jgi:hypothetical protein
MTFPITPHRSNRRLLAPLTFLTLLLIALVIVGLVIGLRSTGGSHGTSASLTTPPPSSSSTSESDSSTASPELSIALSPPWSVTSVASQVPIDRGSLAASDNELYGLHASALEGLDPASGRVLATADITAAVAPVVDSDGVWEVSLPADATPATSKTLSLELLDASSLKLVRSVNIELPSPIGPLGVSLAVAPGTHTVYVGAASTLVAVDSATLKTSSTYTLKDGPLKSVTVDPTGSVVYLADDAGIKELDSATWTLNASVSLPVGAGPLGATQNGVWVHTSGGLQDALAFYSLDALQQTGGEFHGYSSSPSLVTSTDTVSWITSISQIACADPNTGKVRSTSELSDGDAATFSRTVSIGKQLFALATSPQGNELVTVQAPGDCYQ